MPPSEQSTVAPGTTRQVTLDAADPFAADHGWALVAGPATGAATLTDDGALTIAAPLEPGDDSLVVRATDRADPTRTAKVRIALAYHDDDGGCCSTGAPSTIAERTQPGASRRGAIDAGRASSSSATSNAPGPGTTSATAMISPAPGRASELVPSSTSSAGTCRQ